MCVVSGEIDLPAVSPACVGGYIAFHVPGGNLAAAPQDRHGCGKIGTVAFGTVKQEIISKILSFGAYRRGGSIGQAAQPGLYLLQLVVISGGALRDFFRQCINP